MPEEKQEQERADRDHERSEEAHWQVVEAGAEEEERRSEAAPGDEQDDSENEGGAVDGEPKETTEQG
jgi:hypothetical protein